MNEGIDESVLHWFGYIERMGNDRIAKKKYMGEIVLICEGGMPGV